jgi:hypothetical protein
MKPPRPAAQRNTVRRATFGDLMFWAIREPLPKETMRAWFAEVLKRQRQPSEAAIETATSEFNRLRYEYDAMCWGGGSEAVQAHVIRPARRLLDESAKIERGSLDVGRRFQDVASGRHARDLSAEYMERAAKLKKLSDAVRELASFEEEVGRRRGEAKKDADKAVIIALSELCKAALLSTNQMEAGDARGGPVARFVRVAAGTIIGAFPWADDEKGHDAMKKAMERANGA